MSENDQKPQGNIQASDNSNAIGGDIVISGVIQDSSHIHVGHTIGYSAEQVSTLITQISTTFQPQPFDGRCPYKGLEVFEETDAEMFFGREKLVDDLVARVKASRTLFITGPSGSGKSSLVRAGLIHALKRGAIKELNSDRWLYATLKPGRDPIDAAATALSRLKSPELGNYFKTHADQVKVLHECVESVLTDRDDQRFVLFIDQFEEIFTNSPEPARITFMNLLTQAATVEGGRLIVIFSMRSDFVPNCATYPQLNALLNQQFVQIGSMQPEELVSAIAQPALRVGLKIDPDLIAQIINDMKGEPGALPLMQFALKDLFEAEQAKGDMIALTLNGYLQRGGIQKSLERHADSAFAELSEHEQELARNIFSGLIEIGGGTVDTRRTASAKELIPAGTQNHEVETVVQKLANARLITTDAVNVTISHEKLIDAWPWLKKLVNENREVIALQNEIAEDAKEWDEHNRDASYLYTGARLLNARERLENKKMTLNGLAQSFVEAGMQMEESRQQEEEGRRQKELADAHKLAATERRGRLVGRGLLVIAAILIIVLSYDPVRRELLRQQALNPDKVSFPESDYLLGDQRAEETPDDYLISKTYHVAAFSIDTYPVTNERYGFCITAGKCSRPDALQSEYANPDNKNKLVVNITAVDAAEFCAWLRMRLPREQEWELAAQENAFRSISRDVLTNDATDFYEWTISPYDQSLAEWTNISTDPPEVLTLRGGQLSPGEPFKAYMTKRESVLSTHPAYIIGFRCVIDK